jgi:hypothetical protein
VGDWADRRAKHICGQFDEFKGCEGIIADELRLARRWALEEAAHMVESGLGEHFTAGHIRGLKDKT